MRRSTEYVQVEHEADEDFVSEACDEDGTFEEVQKCIWVQVRVEPCR